jgi:hypothetical protein
MELFRMLVALKGGFKGTNMAKRKESLQEIAQSGKKLW